MSNLSKAIESEALALPLEERTRLVIHLLESIESRPVSDPKKVEAAWVAESNRRYEAYLRGEEQAIPAEDVFAELREDDH
ncbi:addiction module protein [Sedimenticola hydrogenitrophicus]|uniref:addiction module protein n=1 Tax=Sedimenticola hydrogenitrophicus TaxID=2967975 RepID=UPI0023AEC612|nr:addiction module protein [Sedimenticola hydrogenitrophicus]